MTDFEKVIDFDNMYRAYRKAKCGKGYKKSSAKFNILALEGVNTLIEQLKSKNYTISKLTVNPKRSYHKEKIFSISLILYLYEMIDIHKTYDNHFMVYVSQIIMLYLNLYSAVCQLYLNENGRKLQTGILYREKHA